MIGTAFLFLIPFWLSQKNNLILIDGDAPSSLFYIYCIIQVDDELFLCTYHGPTTYQSISSAVQPKMSKVMKAPLPPRVDCCLSYAFCLIKLLFDQSAETIGERLAAVLFLLRLGTDFKQAIQRNGSKGVE